MRTGPSPSATATHKESGGEVNRDEVPLIYQQYVEKYFEQIRGAGASKPAAPAGSSQGGAKPPVVTGGKVAAAPAGPGK